jgi:hypothetical protein
MTTQVSGSKRLKSAAAKASAGAAAAKVQVRLAKTQLKQARKVLKAAKKAAKQARRQLDAAGSARPPRPAATLKLKPAVRRSSAKPVRAPKAATRPGIAPKRPLKKPVAPRPSKARAPKAPQMRSAAEIAKTVIERLHAPPPILRPAPVVAPDTTAGPGDSTPETPAGS